MPAGLPVEVMPSRYYRVPRYFFTVLTVAHNRWYRPTGSAPNTSVLCTVYTMNVSKTSEKNECCDFQRGD